MNRAQYSAISRRKKSVRTGRNFRSPSPLIPEKVVIRVMDLMSSQLPRKLAAAAESLNRQNVHQKSAIMRSSLYSPSPNPLDQPGWRNQDHAYDFKAMRAEIDQLKKENEKWSQSFKELSQKFTSNGFSGPQALINYALNCEIRVKELERELLHTTEAMKDPEMTPHRRAVRAAEAQKALHDPSWKHRPVESSWVKWPAEEGGD